jgi:hypothetical protein
MTALDAAAGQDPLAGLSADDDGAYAVAGRRVTTPVAVRSARMASATFLVEAEVAQSVIASTGLSVARKSRGKAVVSLALVRYVDGDLDAYDEIGLAFVVDDPAGAPARPKGGVATYIHKLPVSQEFTCHAGRGIWGFPKWVAPMSVDFDAASVTGTLDGEVRIRLQRGPIPVPSRPMTMVCYSNDAAGGLLRTDWTTHNRSTRLRFGRGSAEVELLGDGPFADDLRALGFPRTPLMTMFAGQMRATFAAPVHL